MGYNRKPRELSVIPKEIQVALSIYSLVCGWPVVVLLTLFGIASCLLVVTIPFGISALRLAGYLVWPFGRSV
jgi:uncharacterized membrane protein YccF (DUF307 family)